MVKANVVYHWDVWGNEEDGWEVNDSSVAARDLEFTDTGEEGVWKTLVDEGIAQGEFSEAEFILHGSGYYIEEAKTGRPVFNVSGLW